jgi:hypothetical protein
MNGAFPGRINRGGEGLPVALAMHVRAPGDCIEHWRVDGVLAGAAFAAPARGMQVLREDSAGRHLLWRGFVLRFDPLRSADYVLNLNNEEPRLFVIARYDPATGLQPLQVTASLDEAQALDSTDLRDAGEHVLSVPMPPDIGVRLAAFTQEHYRPPERKGRRRRPRSGS